MNPGNNGHMREDPSHVEKLTMAMETLASTVDKLADKIEIQGNKTDSLSSKIEINNAKTEILSSKIESFITFAANSIPHNVVYLIFILVVGVLFGIETLQFVFKHFLPKVL